MLFKIILGISAWVLFVGLLLPIIGVPLFFFSGYRFVVTMILKRIFRKDLGEPINVPETAFGTRDYEVWDKPSSTFAFIHVLENRIPLEVLQNRLAEVIHGNTSKIITNYERLTSLHPTQWLGVSFWTKGTTRFDIKHHIKIASISTTKNLEGTVGDWLTSSFERSRPLWDVLFISEFLDENEERRCLFGIRIHHMIGDGYSMLGFLENVFDADLTASPLVLPRHQPMTLAAKFKMWFWMPLIWFADVSDNVFHSDHFSTRKRTQELDLTKIGIDLPKLKFVQKRLSGAVGTPVSMVTTILFLYGTALRKILISQNIGTNQDTMHMGLRSLNVVVSMPRSSPHPEGSFCNHWGRGILGINLAEESPLERLKELVSNTAWMIGSGSFEMNAIFHKINSNFPKFALDAFAGNACASTILVGNLPGPSKPVNICKTRVMEQYVLNGLLFRHTSFTLVCYSYNNRMSISMVSNQNVFDKIMGEKILKKLEEEAEILLSDEIEI